MVQTLVSPKSEFAPSAAEGEAALLVAGRRDQRSQSDPSAQPTQMNLQFGSKLLLALKIIQASRPLWSEPSYNICLGRRAAIDEKRSSREWSGSQPPALRQSLAHRAELQHGASA